MKNSHQSILAGSLALATTSAACCGRGGGPDWGLRFVVTFLFPKS